MTSRSDFGIIALCDAVYKDQATNKAVLAGVFSGDILVENFPASLQLALYVEYKPKDKLSHHIELMFQIEGKKFARIEANIPGNLPGGATMLTIPAIHMEATGEADFEIKIVVDSGRAITLLSKSVRRKP